MKKRLQYCLILFFIATTFFGLSKVAYATSGACSFHSGVNCNRGWQSDGRVYCNDGWTDSIVFYDYMTMCKNYQFAPECVDYINGRDKYIENINVMIDKALDSMVNADMGNPYVAQREQNYINYLYAMKNRQIQRYNEIASICTDNINKAKIEYLNTLKIKICPANSTNINGSCSCDTGYVWDENRTICVTQPSTGSSLVNYVEETLLELNKTLDKAEQKNLICPPNSVLNTDNKCYCNNGYTFLGSKCIQIPPNAHAVNTINDAWLCDEGYREINDGCVLIEKDLVELKKTPNQLIVSIKPTSIEATPPKNNILFNTKIKFIKLWMAVLKIFK